MLKSLGLHYIIVTERERERLASDAPYNGVPCGTVARTQHIINANHLPNYMLLKI